MRTSLFALATLAAGASPLAPATAQDTFLLAEAVDAPVRDCPGGMDTSMPLIAWGADGVTVVANGMALETEPGPFEDAGWALDLAVEDDFAAQLDAYVTCESPFLRGTLGMLVAAAPVTEADPRTEQVVIYKHSWSAGDGIVAGPGIGSVADLAGARVAVQANGPHVDFLGRILADGGVGFDGVEIVWTEALTGDGDTPMAALAEGRADAAAVILPDARVLTSDGTVGTGAEGSVEGATILFSTQEATAVVGDYIAVRADYFDAHRDELRALVAALLAAEEETRAFMADEGDPRRAELAALMADEFLGGLPPEEGVFLWRDAITDGWSGNARHFGSDTDPRRFDVLLEEVNAALVGADRIERPYELAQAGWDWAALSEGLADVSDRELTAFDPEAAAAAVTRLRRTGQLDAATKIDFAVYFEPDTAEFPAEVYAGDFEEIVRLASTYSGAIITVEGHADPLHFLRREQEGADPSELRAIRTSTQNLSLERAAAVVDALAGFAEDEGVRLNRDQFTVDGVGISAPLFDPPRTAEEWRQNMRVVFRVLTAQAEATEFAPL